MEQHKIAEQLRKINISQCGTAASDAEVIANTTSVSRYPSAEPVESKYWSADPAPFNIKENPSVEIAVRRLIVGTFQSVGDIVGEKDDDCKIATRREPMHVRAFRPRLGAGAGESPPPLPLDCLLPVLSSRGPAARRLRRGRATPKPGANQRASRAIPPARGRRTNGFEAPHQRTPSFTIFYIC